MEKTHLIRKDSKSVALMPDSTLDVHIGYIPNLSHMTIFMLKDLGVLPNNNILLLVRFVRAVSPEIFNVFDQAKLF